MRMIDRTVIIGDVHGCSEALEALLDVVKPVPGADRLVLLGDLFDRGPDSRKVFQTVKKLAEDFGEDFILLRGNHEDFLLRTDLTPREKKIWEYVGRKATVDSFRDAGEKMENTIPWLKEHTRLWWRGEQVQCVHAGILVDPPEANDLYTLLHDHDLVMENRYAGRLTVTGHIALRKATWFAGNRETFEELEDGMERELPEAGVLCIDTGCGKGGKLTAMMIRGNRFLLCSVPEKGMKSVI